MVNVNKRFLKAVYRFTFLTFLFLSFSFIVSPSMSLAQFGMPFGGFGMMPGGFGMFGGFGMPGGFGMFGGFGMPGSFGSMAPGFNSGFGSFPGMGFPSSPFMGNPFSMPSMPSWPGAGFQPTIPNSFMSPGGPFFMQPGMSGLPYSGMPYSGFPAMADPRFSQGMMPYNQIPGYNPNINPYNPFNPFNPYQDYDDDSSDDYGGGTSSSRFDEGDKWQGAYEIYEVDDTGYLVLDNNNQPVKDEEGTVTFMITDIDEEEDSSTFLIGYSTVTDWDIADETKHGRTRVTVNYKDNNKSSGIIESMSFTMKFYPELDNKATPSLTDSTVVMYSWGALGPVSNNQFISNYSFLITGRDYSRTGSMRLAIPN